MKIYARVYLITILLIISSTVIAQHQLSDSGYVEIIQDERIEYLLLKHRMQNETDNTITGYRIQIFFDSGNKSKANATKVSDEFRAIYPDQPVYLSFKEPYYRLRVGDFRSRLDAEGFLRELRKDWPNAFTIKEKINLPGL